MFRKRVMTTSIKSIAAFLCVLFMLFSKQGLADQELPVWEFGLGPALFSYPDYPGSNEQNNLVLPFPYVVYRGKDFTIDQREVKKPLFKTPNLELDLSVSGTIPVSSKDNQKRAGMHDLDASLGFGPVLRYQLFQQGLNQLQFELPIRAVVASDFRSVHQEGWLMNPGLFYFYRKNMAAGQRLKITVGTVANFATAENHNYFYGVPINVAKVDRPTYQTSGGFSGMSYSLGVNLHFDEFWLGGFWRGLDMSQSVYRDSPLIETHFSHMFGLTLTWNFATSKETVRGLE